MANPLIDLGQLNRLRTSVIIQQFPELNVSVSYLGEEGIGLRMNGPVTTRVAAMSGTVPSPEPYVPIVVTINLLKSQPLSALYKAQMETLSVIGDITVRPDVNRGALTPYLLSNCSIDEVAELVFNGRVAGYAVSIGGNWNINNALWQ